MKIIAGKIFNNVVNFRSIFRIKAHHPCDEQTKKGKSTVAIYEERSDLCIHALKICIE
jgi:hypothetical protein